MPFGAERFRKYLILSGNTGVAFYGLGGLLISVFCEAVFFAYGARHIIPVVVVTIGAILQLWVSYRFARYGPLPALRNGVPFVAMQAFWLAALVLIFAQWGLTVW